MKRVPRPFEINSFSRPRKRPTPTPPRRHSRNQSLASEKQSVASENQSLASEKQSLASENFVFSLFFDFPAILGFDLSFSLFLLTSERERRRRSHVFQIPSHVFPSLSTHSQLQFFFFLPSLPSPPFFHPPAPRLFFTLAALAILEIFAKEPCRPPT